MKAQLFSIFLTFTLFSTVLSSGFAQNFTTWDLPEGAKARLGKGWIDEIQYSPDGTRLAVAGSIGVWLYDTNSGEELDLFTGYANPVSSVSFGPDGTRLAVADFVYISLYNTIPDISQINQGGSNHQ